MSRGKKNGQMAFITVFTIILVVIGHADMTSAYDELWIKRWIYSFHMPLFVFASGLMCEHAIQTKERFCNRKGKRFVLKICEKTSNISGYDDQTIIGIP